MMREYQVRICERLGVKFPGPTRQSRPVRVNNRSVHARYAPECGRNIGATVARGWASPVTAVASHLGEYFAHLFISRHITWHGCVECFV